MPPPWIPEPFNARHTQILKCSRHVPVSTLLVNFFPLFTPLLLFIALFGFFCLPKLTWPLIWTLHRTKLIPPGAWHIQCLVVSLGTVFTSCPEGNGTSACVCSHTPNLLHRQRGDKMWMKWWAENINSADAFGFKDYQTNAALWSQPIRLLMDHLLNILD